MGFLSLYRKYRPKNFNDLIGQKQVVQTLKNALNNNRIAHAYLFAGPRGTGKTSTAKVFAQALNCENGPTSDPCGECNACKKIQSGQSIDVIEIDAASNRGIDEIRDLREKVKFYPSESKYKVYIIDEVHMLTKGAFNALLKTLEEPPENVVFILATTEPHKVIDTIMSRCQRFDFSLLSTSEIENRLEYICQQEGVKYEKEALNIIAQSSNGGLRDAISILDQAISYTNEKIVSDAIQEMLGKVDYRVLYEFFKHIFNRDSVAAIKMVNNLLEKGNSLSNFVSDLIEYVRQLLLVKECGKESGLVILPDERLLELEEESRNINIDRLLNIIEILSGVEREIKYREQPRLALEMGIIKMTSSGNDSNALEDLKLRLFDLDERLKQLEEKKVAHHLEGKTVIQEDKQKDLNITEVTDNIKENKSLTSSDKQELTIDIVRKAWPVILKEIKEENISVHAFLIESKPVKVENDLLFIQFPQDKSFHKNGAESEKVFIQKVISGILKQSCQLRFTLDGKEDKEDIKGKKKDNLKVQDRAVSNDIVNKVAKLFNGQIIKVDEGVLD